jgi:hypothetical protein
MRALHIEYESLVRCAMRTLHIEKEEGRRKRERITKDRLLTVNCQLSGVLSCEL